MNDFFNGAPEDGEPMTKLSDRIRPGSEAAPWVCREIEKLEAKLLKWAERCGEADGRWGQARDRITELETEAIKQKVLKDHYMTDNKRLRAAKDKWYCELCGCAECLQREALQGGGGWMK